MVDLLLFYQIPFRILFRFRWYGGARKNKLTVIFTLIHLVSHSIPKLGRNLPFVYQSGRISCKKP